MPLEKNKRQLTVRTAPKKAWGGLKTGYILLWSAFILGVSLTLCGCGRSNAEPVSGALIKQSLKLDTLIGDLNGEAKTVLAVSDEAATMDITPDYKAKPGRRTLYNLLLTAKEPLGHTMYVWGGGWNEEDTAAGEEARSIGESPRWREFADMQGRSYNYQNTRYQIHDGLDCSGYVGWVVYNVFENTDGNPGYVEKATGMAESFASNGWGTYVPSYHVTDWKPGDIMSMKGHVWISLGMCEDGSVVLLHASPPGVILNGTRLKGGGKSQAIELAEYYMQTYYPEWYEKYPDCSKENFYLTRSAQMRWNRETLADEEGIAEMTAEEVLELLFLAEAFNEK